MDTDVRSFTLQGVPLLLLGLLSSCKASLDLPPEADQSLPGCFVVAPESEVSVIYKGIRNSKRYCLTECEQHWFIFYGIHDGDTCWCSNQPSKNTRVFWWSECNTRCSGDTSDFCGGEHTSYIALTGYNPGSLGKVNKCWGSLLVVYEATTLLYKGQQNTLHYCRNVCGSFKIPFAIVQEGDQCWCATQLRSFMFKAPYGCNTVCTGDSNEMCGGKLGGFFMLSEIPVDDPGTGFPSGCYFFYIDDREGVIGTHLKRYYGFNRKYQDWEFTSANLTPSICQDFCRKRGYRITGLRNGNKCFCGDKFKPREAHLRDYSECDTPCSGNRNHICGGSKRVIIMSSF